MGSFNGHPPLGVNATEIIQDIEDLERMMFLWAPTLGGECYETARAIYADIQAKFQWAPTLGGECYVRFGYAR